MSLNCSPQALSDAAACIDCGISPGMQMPVLISLLCQIANASGGGGGSGTVTSFSAGNLAPLFTTSVATATTTPALTFALSTQVANTVFAGPATGGDAAPTFRALVAADLPSLSAVYVPVGRTITIAGTANQVVSSAGAQDLSANRTWTLSLPQSIATASTPQFARMGLGVAADATSQLYCLAPSSGPNVQVNVMRVDATTSDPRIILGAPGVNTCAYWQYLKGSNTLEFGVFGSAGFTLDGSGNLNLAGPGVYYYAGNAGFSGTFDATNTVTVSGGIITGVA